MARYWILGLAASLALVGCDGEGPSGEDADGDGFVVGPDCDDDDASINPDAEEDCDNGIDDDCDGDVDAADGDSCEALDEDGDGYDTTEDCDDSDPNVNPGAEEICGNGIDDDCKGGADTGCPEYDEPYYMVAGGRFRWDNSLYEGSGGATGFFGSDGTPSPPYVEITLFDEQYFDSGGSEELQCTVLIVGGDGPDDAGTFDAADAAATFEEDVDFQTMLVFLSDANGNGQVDDNEIEEYGHQGYTITADAAASPFTVLSDCLLDPTFWGDDPYGAAGIFSKQQFGVGVGKMAPAVNDSLAGLPADNGWKPYYDANQLAGGSYKWSQLASAWIWPGFNDGVSWGWEIDEAGQIVTGEDGNAILVDVDTLFVTDGDAMSADLPDLVYTVQWWFARPDTASLFFN